MKIRIFEPGDERALWRIIRRGKKRIFTQGIMDRSSKVRLSHLRQMTENPLFDPSGLFIAEISDEPRGFCGAHRSTKRDQPGAIFYLLESEEKYEATLTRPLLDEALKWARETGAVALEKSTFEPISSSFETTERIRPEALWEKDFIPTTLAAEMEVDLTNFALSEKLKKRIKTLRREGIIFRKCRKNDIPALREFSNQERAYWTKLIDATLARSGPGAVELAFRNDEIIGYSTYFARTLDWEMPEYGPVLVKESERGKGISSILIARSLEYVKLCGARWVRLSCYESKFPVYPRLGFKFTHIYYHHLLRRLD